MANADYLLPQNVKPAKYTLTLEPDLSGFTFVGNVDIKLQVLTPTSTVVFHSEDLEFSAVSLSFGETKMSPKETSFDDKLHRCTLTFPAEIPVGDALLSISFSGKLSTKLCGFYRSQYTFRDESHQIATTQFEATDARKAFPCWDEPAVKSTFDVTLVAPAHCQAISNMPALSQITNEQGNKVVHFAETPIMSTYLLAFVVGEFDYLEGTTKEGVLVRVYAPLGKGSQCEFALDAAVRSLSFFTEWFGIPYPLPKLDLIAIPDFAAGAMENWGLVTYREAALLVSPETSAASKQNVARIVSHELAHQWFGNLVTMRWWTHLWLNEGFARWAEHLSVDHLYPSWKFWDHFVANAYRAALSLDALKSSHAIEVEVRSESEINEIFDAISYAKGASCVRMLAAFVGTDKFQKGLHLYLSKHEYSNTLTEDLWAALSEASGVPVESIMQSWTKQVGYPVVTVEEIAPASSGLRTFRLVQERFLSSGQLEDEMRTQLWHIPITLKTATGKTASYLFTEREGTVSVEASADEWVKFNDNQNGVYRVHYLGDLLSRLVPAIQSNAIGHIDRLGIQNDVFALARSGRMETAQYLELLTAYKNERDYTVWSDVSANLSILVSLFADQPFFGKFQVLVRELFTPVAEQLGWEPLPSDSHSTSLFRALVLSMLVDVKDPKTISEAQRRFNAHVSGTCALPADVRGLAYRAVVSSGGDAEHAKLKETFLGTQSSEEQRRCLGALGASNQSDLLMDTLEFALSDKVRSQDLTFPLSSVCGNPAGRDLAWTFFKDNFERIDKQYGNGAFLITSIVSAVTSPFTNAAKADEIEAFFAAHPVPSAARSLQQSLERVRSNAAWLQRAAEKVASTLDTLVK